MIERASARLAVADMLGVKSPIRNVRQPDHILVDLIAGREAERRRGAAEEQRAATKHDGVKVDPILVNKAKIGQAVRQLRSANAKLSGELSLQAADLALEIILNEPGVRPD